jgi:hypothetical protein
MSQYFAVGATHINIVPGTAYSISDLLVVTPGGADFAGNLDPVVAAVVAVPQSSQYTVSGAPQDVWGDYDISLYGDTATYYNSGPGTITFLSSSASLSGTVSIVLYIDDQDTGNPAVHYWQEPLGGVFVTASQPGLFTSGADTVNFNSLTTDQQAAITAGAETTNGLGGSDTVTLNSTYSTFSTGSNVGDTTSVTAGSGNYNITLGAGSDTVNINGNGNNTIIAGTGSANVSITGSGSNAFEGNLNGSASIFGGGTFKITGNLTGAGSVNGNSVLEIGGASASNGLTTVTFGLGLNNTLIIDQPTTGPLTIAGFLSGPAGAGNGTPTPNSDVIDFANQPGLTLEAGTGVDTGEVDIYNKSNLVDTLIFNNGSAPITTLEPVSDNHGGTEIIVDPTSVALI